MWIVGGQVYKICCHWSVGYKLGYYLHSRNQTADVLTSPSVISGFAVVGWGWRWPELERPCIAHLFATVSEHIYKWHSIAFFIQYLLAGTYIFVFMAITATLAAYAPRRSLKEQQNHSTGTASVFVAATESGTCTSMIRVYHNIINLLSHQ